MALTRRNFLHGLSLGMALTATGTLLPRPALSASSSPGIGLALGAGGANGLAHLLMIEAFEEMKLKPQVISGSSAGAFFAVLYAAGWSASDIKELLNQHIPSGSHIEQSSILDSRFLNMLDLLAPTLDRGGFISGGRILHELLKSLARQKLEDLEIPVKIVATDYWTRKQVVFDSGPIDKIVTASMAAPGVFPPVDYESHVLVDGGLSNPVPWDIIADDAEITVAVDVIGRRVSDGSRFPHALDSIFHSIQILRENIVNQRLEYLPPDIYIKPEIVNIRMLDIARMDEILSQAKPAKEQLKQELAKTLNRTSSLRAPTPVGRFT